MNKNENFSFSDNQIVYAFSVVEKFVLIFGKYNS